MTAKCRRLIPAAALLLLPPSLPPTLPVVIDANERASETLWTHALTAECPKCCATSNVVALCTQAAEPHRASLPLSFSLSTRGSPPLLQCTRRPCLGSRCPLLLFPHSRGPQSCPTNKPNQPRLAPAQQHSPITTVPTVRSKRRPESKPAMTGLLTTASRTKGQPRPARRIPNRLGSDPIRLGDSE